MSAGNRTPIDGEASPPTDASMHETLRFLFDECLRRSRISTRGLPGELLSVAPGNGAMSIGALLEHQLKLLRMLTEFIDPGATESIGEIDMGKPDAWRLEDFERQREELAEAFHQALKKAKPQTFMARRPDMQPRRWADWPVLMRVMRPLTDFATHVGQVNYARRLLGQPVGKP